MKRHLINICIIFEKVFNMRENLNFFLNKVAIVLKLVK